MIDIPHKKIEVKILLGLKNKINRRIEKE